MTNNRCVVVVCTMFVEQIRIMITIPCGLKKASRMPMVKVISISRVLINYFWC